MNHLDIPMTWLHEQGLKGTYVAIYTPTGRNKADMNTKPHGGANLQTMNMAVVGNQHYPSEGTDHYQLLQLGQYNIDPHRGSFLKEVKLKPTQDWIKSLSIRRSCQVNGNYSQHASI